MKITSKKLLLWLHPQLSESKRRVPFEQLSLILSELTPDGRESLVRYLEGNRLLFTDELEGKPMLSLSSHGETQLAADFPVLKRLNDPWQGEWLIVVFMDAPSTDKSFRYLRSVLLQEHCLSLKRGVYLHPGQFSERLQKLLHDSYRSNVVVANNKSWQFGDDQIFIGQNSQLKDIIDVYSGIGKEIETLLTEKSIAKGLSDRQKKGIGSIYDRLVLNMQQDSGIIPYYFPQAATGFELLQSLVLGVDERELLS